MLVLVLVRRAGIALADVAKRSRELPSEMQFTARGPVAYTAIVGGRLVRLGCALGLGALVAFATLTEASCGAFDTETVDAGAASSSSSGGSSSSSGGGSDAGIDAPARTCREERTDFEQTSAITWFDSTEAPSPSILKITTSPKSSNALYAAVTVPATGAGQSSNGARRMDVGDAKVAEVELDAFFGRTPATGTYVEVGCELIARRSASAAGVTTRIHLEIDDTKLQLGGSSAENSVVLPNQPDDADIMVVGAPAWHHVLLRMELATGNGTAQVDEIRRSITVPPADKSPQIFAIKCGVPFADKSPGGTYEAYVDNVVMRLCDR